MGIVSRLTRGLRPVPEHREIGEDLQEAYDQADRCLEFITQLQERGMPVEDLPLGETAFPDSGQVAPTPACGGEIERVQVVVAHAKTRLALAEAQIARLLALQGAGRRGVICPDWQPASGGPTADWQDRSAPCVICPLVLFLR